MEWECFPDVSTVVVALCTLCNHKQMHYSPNVLFTLSEETFSRVQRYTTSKLSLSQHAFPMMLWSLPNWGTALDKRLKIIWQNILTAMHIELQKTECAKCLTILQQSLCWSSQAISNRSSCYQMEGMSIAILSWCCIYSSEPITTSVERYVGHFNSAQLLRIDKTYNHWATWRVTNRRKK